MNKRALCQLGDLSRVYPGSRRMMAGMDSSTHTTLMFPWLASVIDVIKQILKSVKPNKQDDFEVMR